MGIYRHRKLFSRWFSGARRSSISVRYKTFYRSAIVIAPSRLGRRCSTAIKSICVITIAGFAAAPELPACATLHNIVANATNSELEQIRNAALAYLEQTDKPDLNEFKAAFIAELKRGAIIKDEDTIRIGLWLFEDRNGQPCLIREPNHIAPVVHAFGLKLLKRSEGWSVVDDFDETQRFKIEE